ncbi:MAG: GTPase Era, partial [Opitutaceae bacterium]|nr:GTPase Era [Opitutaceae bacterium]
MSTLRTVAIVGRPNVGKSRLFNRLARKRISIVHDQPGVTRDVISAEIADGAYTLFDTGGLGYKGKDTPAALTAASETQVDFAIAAASLILFVIDGLEGITALDEKIAGMLRRSKKPVRLVINKADFDDEKIELAEAYRLGLGEPLRVSAEHGRGEGELRDAILAALGPAPVDSTGTEAERPLGVCFIGRPNVGKSTLVNAFVGTKVAIVSPKPQTTRRRIMGVRTQPDAQIVFVDTPGIHHPHHTRGEYMVEAAVQSIPDADVILYVVDVADRPGEEDSEIGQLLRDKANAPIVLALNKADIVNPRYLQANYDVY